MDNFESLIKTLFESDNYWVKQSYKVELTPEQKVQAGSPKMPRPEIDLIAFNQKQNHLLIIEVKSFLNSKGVDALDIIDSSRTSANRYKMFTRRDYRNVVIEATREQLIQTGFINNTTTIQLALAAGNIVESRSLILSEHFIKNEWLLLDPKIIKNKLLKLKDTQYSNDLVTLTTKMLLN